MDINVFTQIGFVVLIGLASKNAILIVEFAKARREEGIDRRAATLHACELRLRPIMMTSFAFILGVVPLVVAHGAGAEMRRTLGTAVFSGMLGVTFFGILLTPVFFFVIDRAAGLHLFSAGHLHDAGNLVLEILSLRILKRLARALPARSGATKSVPFSREAQPSAVANKDQPEEETLHPQIHTDDDRKIV
jgi:multidrug efflux pump